MMISNKELTTAISADRISYTQTLSQLDPKPCTITRVGRPESKALAAQPHAADMLLADTARSG